jgi:hypothetical protein
MSEWRTIHAYFKPTAGALSIHGFHDDIQPLSNLSGRLTERHREDASRLSWKTTHHHHKFTWSPYVCRRKIMQTTSFNFGRVSGITIVLYLVQKLDEIAVHP